MMKQCLSRYCLNAASGCVSNGDQSAFILEDVTGTVSIWPIWKRFQRNGNDSLKSTFPSNRRKKTTSLQRNDAALLNSRSISVKQTKNHEHHVAEQRRDRWIMNRHEIFDMFWHCCRGEFTIDGPQVNVGKTVFCPSNKKKEMFLSNSCASIENSRFLLLRNSIRHQML